MHYTADGYGEVRIVALDVTVPGLHYGEIDECAMRWLESALAAEPKRPTILLMHQRRSIAACPISMPTIAATVRNFRRSSRGHPPVERTVCGHVHRFMQLRLGGTVLCTAHRRRRPIALRLKADAEPASRLEPPACLLHHWRPEVGLVTHLSLIGRFPGPYPFA